MTREKEAAAIRRIAEGLWMYADALFEQPAAGTVGKPGAAVDSPPTAAPADSSMPEFPPLESWEEAVAAPAAPPVDQREYVLGRCPTHDKPWTVKEGGVSKAGKPYGAFWKCSGKDADGSYCNKKPDASWVKTHNPESVLVGA